MRYNLRIYNPKRALFILMSLMIISFILTYAIMYNSYVNKLGEETDQLIAWNDSRVPNEVSLDIQKKLSPRLVDLKKRLQLPTPFFNYDTLAFYVDSFNSNVVKKQYINGNRYFNNDTGNFQSNMVNIQFGVYSTVKGYTTDMPKSYKPFVNTFYTYLINLLDGKNSDSTLSYEGSFAKSFGLDEKKFRIPWVYFCDTNGIQFTFPATSLTSKPKSDPTNNNPYKGYDPRTRVWFQDANNAHTPFFNDYLKVSSMYTDVRENDKKFLVRTLTFKFRPDQMKQDFTFGLDLMYNPIKSYQDKNISLSNLSFFSIPFLDPGAIFNLKFNLILILILLFLLLISLFIRGSYSGNYILFSQKAYMDAEENSEQALSFTGSSQKIKSVKYSVNGTYSYSIASLSANLSTAFTRSNGENFSKTVPLTIALDKDPFTRAISIADISFINKIKFKSFPIERNEIKKTYLCLGKFTNKAEIEILFYNEKGNIVDNIGERNKKLIRRLFGINKETFLLNEESDFPKENLSGLQLMNESSEYLNFIKEREYIYEGRYAYKNGLKIFTEIYKNSKLRAVCKDVHLESILESGKQNAFSKGDSIERIIVYEDESNWKRILNLYKAELKEIARFYDNEGSRIFVCSISELPQKLREFRDKDFALVGDNLVVVTERVIKETIVSEISGDKDGSLIIEGYISWRRADFHAYDYLFKSIESIQSKKPLMEFVS